MYRRPTLGVNKGGWLCHRARGASGGRRLHHRAPRAKGSGASYQCALGAARGELLYLGARVGGFVPQTHLPPDGAKVSYQFLYFFLF